MLKKSYDNSILTLMMISEKLTAAINFENAGSKKILPEERPLFHLTPLTGWCNDPNGFCYYKGEYHIFYQYHPYSVYWGPMHWGHAVSKDLIKWNYLPCALAPDMDYDRDGCFSGSSIELPDGRHLLMYTGVHDGIQEQCVATGDGLVYEKYENNPVITVSDLPEGCSGKDFRDPKLIKLSDGSYGAVIVSCDENHDGRALLYKSPDGFNWSFEKILDTNRGRFGKVWECPDLFQLENRNVMIISPTDMVAQGFEYHNGHGNVCFIDEKINHSLDYGLDFYAPQTTSAPDGRRIMTAWMQSWSTCNNHPADMKFFGQMIIPRELVIKNNRIHEQPVKELENYYTGTVEYKNVEVEGSEILEGIKGRNIDLRINAECQGLFSVKFACGKNLFSEFTWNADTGIAELSRVHSGTRYDTVNSRKCLLEKTDGKIQLRIILDKNCCEIFINGGIAVMSMCIETPVGSDGIEFISSAKAVMDVICNSF